MLVRIVAGIAALLDGMLSYWVEDLNLTDPLGHQLAASLAQIVQLGADLYAQLLEIFVSIAS